MLILCSLNVSAQSTDPFGTFKKILNTTVGHVHAESNVDKKRVLLTETLNKLDSGIELARDSQMFTKEKKLLLNELAERIEERREELEGRNGFSAISDSNLDAFSVFIQQDMEQAFFAITGDETLDMLLFWTLVVVVALSI